MSRRDRADKEISIPPSELMHKWYQLVAETPERMKRFSKYYVPSVELCAVVRAAAPVHVFQNGELKEKLPEDENSAFLYARDLVVCAGLHLLRDRWIDLDLPMRDRVSIPYYKSFSFSTGELRGKAPFTDCAAMRLKMIVNYPSQEQQDAIASLFQLDSIEAAVDLFTGVVHEVEQKKKAIGTIKVNSR